VFTLNEDRSDIILILYYFTVKILVVKLSTSMLIYPADDRV